MGVGRRWRGVFDIVTSDFFFSFVPLFYFFFYIFQAIVRRFILSWFLRIQNY
ncbi:hypothetical protein GQ55_5G524500 [Panicum hallii var. hallii]|uniref:Transmembrane protein n=1 Tax=Panicum hallii var. hallii TaxID=1504633 RepID=A0A2T7DSV0_9POAL|nr:hypothetical protein GQ55_5G524500 [Panicum hallii var. hallii]